MIELNLEKINRNDWKHRLKEFILNRGKSTVKRELVRHGFAAIINYISDDGAEIMDAYYMSAGQCISMIRVEFSKGGRAKSFAIYS